MDLEISDAELVRRIGGGIDTAAESAFVHRMAPRIRLYGLRHLRNECAAEDLTQDVLTTTLESLRMGRLREPEKLAHFVMGTCRMQLCSICAEATTEDNPCYTSSVRTSYRRRRLLCRASIMTALNTVFRI